jgi:hypothetical protein
MAASGRIALQHGLGVKDDKGVVNDKGPVKLRKSPFECPMSTRSGAGLFF